MFRQGETGVTNEGRGRSAEKWAQHTKHETQKKGRCGEQQFRAD